MKTDKEQDIKDFAYSENSMLQKAKRYNEDIAYLLDLLQNERRRHADCEEEMMVYNPADISKVQRLDLLDNIVAKISADYNRNPFTDPAEGEQRQFRDYTEALRENANSEIRLLGEIFHLLHEHFNRPSAC